MKEKILVWLLLGALVQSLSECEIQLTDSTKKTVIELSENGQSENGQSKNEQSENAQSENAQSGNGQSENGQLENEQPEREQSKSGKLKAEQQKDTESGEEIAGEEPDSPEITLVMVGDILLHDPVAESGSREDGSYNFDAIFANVKDRVSEADLALVNQEVILGGSELGITGYPCFNAPYELGDSLVDTGFDVILHGTNHALDKGRKGLENCLDFWENTYPDIAVLGINESAEAQEEIFIFEQDGIRVAILNYTYGTNGISMPENMPYAVNLLEEEKVIEDLKKADKEADFVIVCPHWGTEYKLVETEEQKYWADIFEENGADLVIGTHPHVIEPVEWFGEEGNMLVYYSLGNFVNWTSGTGEGVANRMVGGMAEVTIGPDETGDVVITDYDMEPLICHVEDGTDGVTVYFMEDYTEELAEKNEIRKQDSNFSLEYCEKLWEEVIGE